MAGNETLSVMPDDLLDSCYDKYFSKEGPADGIFLRQASRGELEDNRRSDIADTFSKFRGPIGAMLSEMGIEKPEDQDQITAYVAVQERRGFESGVKFVFDNADVTSKAEARRRSSVLRNMKTAGV